MTGMFSGGSSNDAQEQQQAAPAQQQQQNFPQQSQNGESGPCAWELKQFLQCAQNQHDLTLCEGFNEAIRQCKVQNNL